MKASPVIDDDSSSTPEAARDAASRIYWDESR
jgi:hypothetical protein